MYRMVHGVAEIDQMGVSPATEGDESTPDVRGWAMRTAPGEDLPPVSARLDAGDEGRPAAHVAAYELLELSQNECAADRIDQLLARAEAMGWHEVAFVLHYARLARVMPSGGDTSGHLSAMFAEASAADDLALLALALATQAERTAYDPSSSHEDEGTLAR